MSKKFLDLHKEFNYKGEWQGTYIKIDISLIMKGVLQSLTATQLKVLLVIAAHMNEEGKCFPSIDRIMELTTCARQTVIDAIKALINVGVDGVLNKDREERQSRSVLTMINSQAIDNSKNLW